MLVNWSAWSDQASLADVDGVIGTIVPNAADRQGVWYLLVVMSVDEAGNVEIWPRTQLDNSGATNDGSPGSPNEIASVFEPGDEERNWERWYVPPLAETVDTIIEPFFWHDTAGGGVSTGTVDAGENTFGDADVIPYPAPALFNPLQNVPGAVNIGARVAGIFRITLVTDDLDATVNWSISENGTTVGSGTGVAQSPLGSGIVDIVLPDVINVNGYLGSPNRTPTYYTFQASTVTSGADGVADSSPATFSFVVVDNVANFIRNPDETQPIRESDVN